MKIQNPLPFLLVLLLAIACTPTLKVTGPQDDGNIEIVFLHINDVYEIAPLEGGKVGGMARLATLRKQLLAENKNTFTVHAGDFLNPSLIGTLKYQGDRIRGRQMVEVMNACQIDLVTFGNHEFDLEEKDVQKRLNESEFAWTSANVLQNICDHYYPFYSEKDGRKEFVSETYVFEATDADGTSIKVGIFGVTLPSNPQPFVYYEDYTKEALKAYEYLSKITDIVIGLTHLEIDQDMALAKKLPGVPLIMGGHDHDHMLHKVGDRIIAKADANVKTAYVHRVKYHRPTKSMTIASELVAIDESIPFDREVSALVKKWNDILYDKVGELVPNPQELIYEAKEPLDGRESSIRNKQTNLGEVITQGMLQASTNEAVAAILNGGSVRIDDQISGSVTPVDIFRALPYGGAILDVELKGGLLQQVLDTGREKRGTGAYLQRGNITWDDNNKQWMIQNKALEAGQNYQIMLNDYLLLGHDIPILTKDNPGVLSVIGPKDPEKGPKSDVRLAVIDYLKSL